MTRNRGWRSSSKVLTGALAAALLMVTVAGAAGGPTKTAADRATSSQVVDPITNPKPAQEITGIDCATQCDLYARAGQVTVAGHDVPIWGYTDDPAGAPTIPGPTIVATAGPADAHTHLHITVHNELGVETSLSFPRLPVDAVGGFAGVAAPGGTASYDIDVNGAVGTSTYQAGATDTGDRQVAMGLAGVLIVRPPVAACPIDKHCTYGDPSNGGVGLGSSAFAAADIADDEAVVALNDLDPAFALDPLGYDMATYRPTLHLIDGKAFPDTDVIDTTAGGTVALRYANLGTIQHSMELIGGHQDVLGRDASVLAHSDDAVSPLLTPGETLDASTRVALDAPAGQRFALYDAGRDLRNATDGGYGGALTFINVWGQAGAPGQPVATLDPLAIPTTTPPGDVTDGSAFSFTGTTPAVAGPITGRWYIDGLPTFRVVQDGETTDGSSTVASATAAFTAADVGAPISGAGIPPSSSIGTVTDGSHVTLVDASNTPVNATATATNVELTIGAAPTPISIPDGGGPFTGTVGTGDLADEDNGSHVLWVELSTDGSSWGVPRGVAFSLDRGGPSMIGTSIDPLVTNGSTDLTLRTTGDTTVTGTSDVVEGRYSLDATCAAVQTGTLMGPDPAPDLRNEPIQGFVATIPHANVGAEGVHHALVAAKDALGHWPNSSTAGGAPLCDDVTYAVDTHGPSTSGAEIAPNPTNGNVAYAGSTNFLDSIRILARVSDPSSNGVSSRITKAEAFLDGSYADASGHPIALPGGAVTGQGIELIPVDGQWDSPVETVYTYVPLATVRALTPGVHGVWIHGMDEAGNWGDVTTDPSTTLDYEPDAPTINFLTVNGTTLSTGATAVRPDMTITTIEYSIGTSPAAPGAGTAFPAAAITQSANVATVTNATIPAHTATQNVWVRARDSLGHWSAAVGLPTVTTTFATTGGFGGGSSVLQATAVAGAGDIQSVQYGTTALGSGATPPAQWQTINGSAGASPVVVDVPATPAGRNVWLRAVDSQGNIGPAISLPVASNVTRSANGRTVSGTASSATSTIAVVQYHRVNAFGQFIPPPPANGWTTITPAPNQASVSFTSGAVINPGGRVYVRVQDAAGNWGPAVLV